MSGILESNCSYASSCLGIGHEFGMIFSNAQDEAGTQYEQLHGEGNLGNARVNLGPHRS